MAVDMFLKLDDVKGESSDDKHKDEMEVLAWSWGIQQSGSTHSGGGGGAGKVNVSDISVTKYIDRASPSLMLGCCSGKHFKEADLAVRKRGANPLEYIKITMKQVLISSISPGFGGGVGDDRPSETVTFNFAEFKTEYTPQKPDGSSDASITIAWNIAENVKV
jgi:type VI secretion system secreted protein Hcp